MPISAITGLSTIFVLIYKQQNTFKDRKGIKWIFRIL
jgi:hypothetical protein